MPLENEDLKSFNLPDADEITRRLTAVEDEPHLVANFYPLVASKGGRSINGMGVVLMLVLAIEDYSVGLPPFMKGLLQANLRSYIEALVDDDEVKADALETLNRVESEVGRNAS